MKRLIGLALSIFVVHNQMFFAADAAGLDSMANWGGSSPDGGSGWSGGKGGSSTIIGSGSLTNTLSTSSPGYVPNATSNSLANQYSQSGTTSTGTTFKYAGPGPGAGLSDQSTAITGSGSSVNTLSTSSPGYVPNSAANSLCGPTSVGTTSTGTTFSYSGPGPGAGLSDQSTAITGSGSSVNTLSTSSPGYVPNSYSNGLANQYSPVGTTSTGTTFSYSGPGPGAGLSDQSTAITGSGSSVNTLSTSSPGYVPNSYSNGLANQYNSVGTTSTGTTFSYSGPGPGAGLSDQSTAITGSGSSVNTLSTSSPGYVPNSYSNGLANQYSPVGTTSTGTTFSYSGPGPGDGLSGQSTAITGSGSSVNTLSTSSPDYVPNSYSNGLANQYSPVGTTSTGTTFSYSGPGPGDGLSGQSTAIYGSGSSVNTLSTSTPGYVPNSYANGLADQSTSVGTTNTGSSFNYSGPGGDGSISATLGSATPGYVNNSTSTSIYGGTTYTGVSPIGTVSGGWGSGSSGTGNGVNTYSNSSNSLASTSCSVYPSGASTTSNAGSSSGYSSGSSSASNTGTPANYNTGSIGTPHWTPSTATYAGGTTANNPLTYPTSSSSSGGSLPACGADPTATFNPDY